MIGVLLKEIFFRPIFNLLLLFVFISGWNLWLGIILLTIFIKLLLLKPTSAGNDLQKHMTQLQPKINEIKEKYKDDPQKMNEEMMKLFQSNQQSFKWMAKWCLMMLIQIPVFIWLYRSVKDLADIVAKWDANMIQRFWEYIYSFLQPIWITVDMFSRINPYFLGMNLLESHNMILAILAGILMYFQMKFMSFINPSSKQSSANIPWMPKMPDLSKMIDMMNMLLVFMMIMFVRSMPAAIWLYIVTLTIFSIVQLVWQYWPMIKVRFFNK